MPEGILARIAEHVDPDHEKRHVESILKHHYAPRREADVARDLNRTVRGWSAYFGYGSVSKARHAVKLHEYHAVRRFLRRRHKVAGPGYRQFPMQAVFGTLGVLSPESCPRLARSAARMP